MESYTNRDNQHTVYLHRLATGLVNDYTTPNLKASYKTARSILLDAEQITTQTQLNKITAGINSKIKSDTNEMWLGVTDELNDTAAYGQRFKRIYSRI